MISDAALPPGLAPSATATVERAGVCYTAARWTPRDLARLAETVERGAGDLAALPDERLLAAWTETVDDFRDPDSAERRRLGPSLARLCALSEPGLDAGLEAVLGGVAKGPAGELFERARHGHASAGVGPRDGSAGGPRETSGGTAGDRSAAPTPRQDGGPVLIVTAANLPALALQPLLPALALRRPVILKSPSSEPLFAPAFVRALVRREPALGAAVAALTWPGGDRALEEPLLAAADRVVAYGEATTLDDLGERLGGKLIGYGPKTSLALVGAEVDPEEVAAGLARDVALFDQRGCLSVQAVYTAGPTRPLAEALARQLAELAECWPPGPIEAAAAAGVQQIRNESRLRGLYSAELPLRAGTVVVETQPGFLPSPGLRTVRVHPLDRLERLPEILAPWAGRLQGAALAGTEARALAPALEALGLSRLAPPGELQTPDALWHNGGIDPLVALAAGRPDIQ